MDSAASALRYWERKQEVVANNLANVSTDGFKAQRVFAKLLDGVRPTADATSDLSVGTLKQTTNDLDVAINGNGFFVVQTANGERYTRGGSLHIDPKHQLVDVEVVRGLLERADAEI
jgi:flagellar basal-body rod protein FlgF